MINLTLKNQIFHCTTTKIKANFREIFTLHLNNLHKQIDLEHKRTSKTKTIMIIHQLKIIILIIIQVQYQVFCQWLLYLTLFSNHNKLLCILNKLKCHMHKCSLVIIIRIFLISKVTKILTTMISKTCP